MGVGESFKIVGLNVYKLDLPPSMKIHPVFNAVKLRSYHKLHHLGVRAKIAGCSITDSLSEYLQVEDFLQPHFLTDQQITRNRKITFCKKVPTVIITKITQGTS